MPRKDMRAENPAESGTLNFVTHEGPPPDFGAAVFEREIPSDPALVPPLIVRTVEFLRDQSLVEPEEENKVGLCLEEALQNAVLHGNEGVFEKKVRLAIFKRDLEMLFVVSDEGRGFDRSEVKSPVSPETIWAESGRGLFLICHYMDRAAFYESGSILVMTRFL
jgi:anti-sigma regulatory factor (Ser/Thr protein kinase)